MPYRRKLFSGDSEYCLAVLLLRSWNRVLLVRMGRKVSSLFVIFSQKGGLAADPGPALSFLDVCYCLVPSSNWSKAEIVCQALPGQQHCYFLNKDAPLPDGRSLQGTLISKIAFQHPGRVPLILNLIRHQVAYNTLIGSCVKRTVLKEGGYRVEW